MVLIYMIPMSVCDTLKKPSTVQGPQLQLAHRNVYVLEQNDAGLQ